ncbi:hypothetical protein ACFFJY_14430 [Fictibacillus aquaticus]|uniref:Uncharacterized protein n=1 Tax=Fictibacillus aquaticus TaxID=2021314 RepID=A0A235FDX4_9BACL|nr:hypothetical protein [Fictibacillus aquaticus]OYD59412.1 hypothetical protein CGZ90_05855 [Fictibacillus aquaticus]
MASFKKIAYGIWTIVIGIIFKFVMASLYDNGSDGLVNAGVVYNGIMFLTMAIIFLCGTMFVCTLMIVEAIKNK